MEQPARTSNLEKNVTSLATALRTARIEGVERSQVVAELRGAEIARLEMLRDAISPVLAQVPQGIDLFDAGIVPGEHPRLFIDMIGFVEMGRDRRTYRFVQDTRHGRVVMAETDKIDVMEEAVTHYIARRMVERERALASDGTLATAMLASDAGAASRQAPLTAAPARVRERTLPPRKRRLLFLVMSFIIQFLGTFTLGMLFVAAVYFGYPLARIWLTAHFGWPPV